MKITQFKHLLIACFSLSISPLLTLQTAYSQCTPTGDQNTYGTGQWIGYVYADANAYSVAPATVAAATYRGYVTETANFDRDYASGSVSGNTVCGTYADNFGIKYKMQKNFTPGYYTITVGADDGYRLSIDGGATFLASLSDWTPHAYQSKTATILLSGSTDLVLEFFERNGSARISFNAVYASCDNTAPTEITGAVKLDCTTTSATLTATGGTLAVGGTYQWGTGTMAGQNVIAGQSAATITVSPTVSTTYWVRRLNASPCTGYTDAAFATVNVTIRPGNPAAFGDNAWNVYGYNGSNLDVAADTYYGYYTQNSLGFDTTTAWEQTGSMSAASGWQGCAVPADLFTFVHKRRGFPCGRYTVTMKRWDDEAVMYINGVQVWAKPAWSGGLVNEVVGIFDLDENTTIEVRTRDLYSNANATLAIMPASVPPSYISGNANIYCNNATTTLTAAGGSISGNTVYQWGTGAVGQNILAGQNGASITVSPTADTTYWVRLANYTACSSYSDAVTVNVTVTGTPGNPAEYGDAQWNAYAYAGSSLTLSNASYMGYYTQNTLGFDTTTGTNSWLNSTSPSSAPGYSGCTVPNDNFILVYKRRGFDCGSYKLTLTRWDDDAELYIDGVKVWSKAVWSGSTVVNEVVGTYSLNENSKIEFRVRETTGVCNATLILTPLSITSVAPTVVAAPTITLCGNSTTLTAMGGTLGTGASYQWGTGVVGSNIIAGATAASLSVSPLTTTTYWVRIKTNCNTYTAAATATVNATATIPGTLSAASVTVCKNTLPSAITLSGHSGSIIKWQSAANAAFTSGVTDIASSNPVLTPTEIGPLTATRYFRAVVQNGSCNQLTTPVLQITVPAPVVWNGSWSSIPSTATAIEVQTNLMLDTHLSVCSCEVKNNAVLTVNPDVNFTVKGKITVAPGAQLIVHNNAALLQTDNIPNQGSIELHRNSSKIKRLDYTMWSSPVEGQQLLAFSPQTLTNRFYEYNTATSTYNTVAPENNFEAGKGYLIRTPNNHPATATVFSGTFIGTPHNGDMVKPLAYNEGQASYNAVGNPYPSPISVQEFINANINNIEGTLWFWRKSNDCTQSSYTTLTKFAYVANKAPGGENEYAVNPYGVINTGQGFIVKTLTGAPLVFNNSMRVGNSSNQFFRMSSQSDPASRFWLNLTDTNGSFSQAVVGYTPEATMDYDNGIDGKAFTDNNINLYSLQGENKLAIQGRSSFEATDVVTLGIKATAAGSYTFSLGEKDGLFAAGQKVYLLDNSNGSVNCLSSGSYTFVTEAGTFDNRFQIVYSPNALGTANPVYEKVNVAIYSSNGQITVQSDKTIKAVVVYDLLGRELLNKTNIDTMSFTSSAIANTQVLIVKATMDNGQVTEKKLIVR